MMRALCTLLSALLTYLLIDNEDIRGLIYSIVIVIVIRVKLYREISPELPAVADGTTFGPYCISMANAIVATLVIEHLHVCLPLRGLMAKEI